MNEYPNIEREVPAWAPRPRSDNDPICPMNNPNWLPGLAQFVRATNNSDPGLTDHIRRVVREEVANAVREMDREKQPAGTFSDAEAYVIKDTPPDLAEQLAREAAEKVEGEFEVFESWLLADEKRGKCVGVTRIKEILLPLFREAVNGKPAEGRGGEG